MKTTKIMLAFSLAFLLLGLSVQRADAVTSLIFQDDFNRSASSTVGNNWTDVNSKYSISGNALVGGGTNTSFLVRPLSEAAQSTEVQITFVASSTGQISVGTNWNGSNGYLANYNASGHTIRIRTLASNGAVSDLYSTAFTATSGTSYILTLTSLSNGSSSALTATIADSASSTNILATISYTDSNSIYQNIGQAIILNSLGASSITNFASYQIVNALSVPSPYVSARSTSTVTIAASSTSGGVAPYTYRWDKSTTADFATSSGTLLSGETSTSISDTPPSTAGTFNFYRLTVTSSDGQMVTSDPVGVGANQPFIFDRPLVVQRNHLCLCVGPSPAASSTNTFQSNYLVPVGVSDIRVNFANTYSFWGGTGQLGEYSNAYNNEITIQAAALVLDSSGTLISGPTQLTFNGGQTSVTLPYTSGISSDALPISIANGQSLLIRTYVVAPDGGKIPYMEQALSYGASGSTNNLEPGATNSATNSIMSLSADFSPGNGLNLFAPVGVYGTIAGTSSVSGYDTHGIIQIGDSIQEGTQWGANAAASSGLPYLNLGRAGESVDTFAGMGGQVRQAIANGSPILFDEFGVNGLRSGGLTAEQVKSSQLEIWTKFAQAGGKRLITTTLTPLSTGTSTASFQSTSTQTVSPYAAERASYNDYLRDGTAAAVAAGLGLEYYNIDVASAMETSQDSSIWSNASGAAYTDDGVHPNTLGIATITSLQQANIIAALTAPYVEAPSVTTDAASSVSTSTAVLNGSVTADNYASSTARGFNIGLTAAYGATSTESGSFAIGAFATTVSALVPNTTYHYRAFASNSAGTTYGSDQTFTTDALPSSDSSGATRSSDVAPQSSGGGGYAPMFVPLTAPAPSPCLPGQAFNTSTGQPCLASSGNPNPSNPANSAIATARPAQVPSRDLQSGMNDSDVILLQRFLNSSGYVVAISGPGSVGKETSFFGSLTRAALAKFQKAKGISPAVGYFGPITRAYIKSH